MAKRSVSLSSEHVSVSHVSGAAQHASNPGGAAQHSISPATSMLRIRGKQAPPGRSQWKKPAAAQKQAPRNKLGLVSSSKKNVAIGSAPITFKAAVAAKLIPKARKPFALFTQSKAKGRWLGACGMKDLSKQWRELSVAERGAWGEAAATERAVQREAALTSGLNIRNLLVAPRNFQKVAPAKQPREQQMATRYGPYIVEARPVAGQGSFGTVVCAVHGLTGRRVAIKVGSGDDIKIEVDVYTKLSAAMDCHLPFVRMLGECAQPPFPWIALDFIDSGSLHQHICFAGALADDVVQAVSFQSCLGLGYLHRNGVIHTDFKPGNILFRSATNEMFIADFGTSEFFNTSTGEHTGTPRHAVYTTAAYRASELWMCGDHVKPCLKAAIDVWSFGAVLFEVAAGLLLFESTTGRGIHNSIKQWCVPRSSSPTLRVARAPFKWRRLICACCDAVARCRPAFTEDPPSWMAAFA